MREPISEQELREIEALLEEGTVAAVTLRGAEIIEPISLRKLRRLIAEIRRLRARLEAVFALHHHDGYQHDGSAACRCGADHPCPTHRAAEGSED